MAWGLAAVTIFNLQCKRRGEEEGSEGMVTYRFMNIWMSVSMQKVEGGIQHELAMVLQRVHASVSVVQSASQPVRCTSLAVHGGLALVVAFCQADWSDVDCCMLHHMHVWSNLVFSVSEMRIYNYTSVQVFVWQWEPCHSSQYIHTHPPMYTTDMTHASTTHKHTLLAVTQCTSMHICS